MMFKTVNQDLPHEKLTKSLARFLMAAFNKKFDRCLKKGKSFCETIASNGLMEEGL